MIEIYGPESSGKHWHYTYAEAQKQEEFGFIDAEHAFDRNYAEKLGVDIEILSYLNLIMENKRWDCRKFNSLWSNWYWLLTLLPFNT
jgi:RecA/RadA recombinase